VVVVEEKEEEKIEEEAEKNLIEGTSIQERA
jgi:hypothetical protein